jgi:hypothetical protein
MVEHMISNPRQAPRPQKVAHSGKPYAFWDLRNPTERVAAVKGQSRALGSSLEEPVPTLCVSHCTTELTPSPMRRP